jgi:DHA2 family multidrug resistance protein-like MFS transporter
VPFEAAATARDTLGGAVGVAGQLSEQVGAALLGASREAFVDGLQFVAVCATVITIGLTVMAVLWLRQVGAEGAGGHGGVGRHSSPAAGAPEPCRAGAA